MDIKMNEYSRRRQCLAFNGVVAAVRGGETGEAASSCDPASFSVLKALDDTEHAIPCPRNFSDSPRLHFWNRR